MTKQEPFTVTMDIDQLGKLMAITDDLITQNREEGLQLKQMISPTLDIEQFKQLKAIVDGLVKQKCNEGFKLYIWISKVWEANGLYGCDNGLIRKKAEVERKRREAWIREGS